MSVTPAILTPTTQLTGSAAAIYTNSTRAPVMIKRAVFTNVDTGSQTVTVYRVPSGGSAVAANIVIDAFPLSTLQAYVAPELSNMVLAVGDAIFAKASAVNSINATMSGFTTG